MLIPNSTVYKNAITVQTGYETVRDEATVRVAHGTDLEQARDVGLQALSAVQGVGADPAPQVLVEELGGRTIDLRLLFWTAPQQAEVRRVRDEVLRGVVLAYGSAGVEMPTDILQLEGSDSLTTALRAAQEQPGRPVGRSLRPVRTAARRRARRPPRATG